MIRENKDAQAILARLDTIAALLGRVLVELEKSNEFAAAARKAALSESTKARRAGRAKLLTEGKLTSGGKKKFPDSDEIIDEIFRS